MAKTIHFQIDIRSGNSAFAEYPEMEIARVLRDLADRVEQGEIHRVIYDVNGNKVGAMVFTVDEDEDE